MNRIKSSCRWQTESDQIMKFVPKKGDKNIMERFVSYSDFRTDASIQ